MASRALQHSDWVEVRSTKDKGRGVFARRAIPKGETFETVPVLVFDSEDVFGRTHGSVLEHYVFGWDGGKVALPLGYGCLYNHSYEPSAVYEQAGAKLMRYVALRPIKQGEEITINYNGNPDDRSPLAFEVR